MEGAESFVVGHGASYSPHEQFNHDLEAAAKTANMTWEAGYRQGIEYVRKTVEPTIKQVLDDLAEWKDSRRMKDGEIVAGFTEDQLIEIIRKLKSVIKEA